MKRLLNLYPACRAFIKRLWFQLAVSYTLLAFCAMLLLIVILFGINDYSDFRATLTLDTIAERVASEKLTVAQAIGAAGNTQWWDRARHNLREKLLNLEHNDNNTAFYRITNSSRPEVYMQLSDSNDRLLRSDPVELPRSIAAQFAAQQQGSAAQSSVQWLAEHGPIWVDMPITDGNAGMIGRLRLLYIAEFDLWVQLQSVFDFLGHIWCYVFLLSVPIGIACGLLASRYVTSQLQKMNAVTESWRQGHFEARIELPNDDVLIRHSQYLNNMAQDLETYLRLTQSLAVNDERNRLARELHDTVKQKLFALGLQLATVKAKPAVMEAAREHILEAETITREAQHDLMEIITQLRPVSTSHTALHERIGLIADDFRRRFGVRIALSHTAPVRCNAHIEHHVLRIAQESLMNAVRHGKASSIVIASTLDRDMATLTIHDNGSGFDTDKKIQGYGIASMRDRVRDLPHGSFTITSTAGIGTQITLTWKNAS